jgi:hypothetical protein
MLSVKTNPVGIDVYIQKLQTKIHNLLISADYWNIADQSKYAAYGRAYRNKSKDGYIAEVFTEGGEYKEVYWDDTLTAISFFGLSDKQDDGPGNNQVDVHFVMMANLDTLGLEDKDGKCH